MADKALAIKVVLFFTTLLPLALVLVGQGIYMFFPGLIKWALRALR